MYTKKLHIRSAGKEGDGLEGGEKPCPERGFSPPSKNKINRMYNSCPHTYGIKFAHLKMCSHLIWIWMKREISACGTDDYCPIRVQTPTHLVRFVQPFARQSFCGTETRPYPTNGSSVLHYNAAVSCIIMKRCPSLQ